MARILVLCFACVLAAGCVTPKKGKASDPRSVSIHIHDAPERPGQYASGIDPKSIKVTIGSYVLPFDELIITPITKADKKVDPSIADPEFMVEFDPRPKVLAKGDEVHVFYSDYASNLVASKLIWLADGSYEYQSLSEGESRRLHGKYFPPRTPSTNERGATYDIEQYGIILWKGANVYCGLGDGFPTLYKVKGSHFRELRRMRLDTVSKVEAIIEGEIDTEKMTIDLRYYRIKRIYPLP
ncbi:MAG: hypothetical protein QF473_25550 [Planctomycetota bacterium]|nr:hypothetical protein [Planctomycetota bacterium]